MKPGYKTTEFWLSSIAIVLGSLLASGTFGQGTDIARGVGAIVAALAAMGYSSSRGKAKAASNGGGSA